MNYYFCFFLLTATCIGALTSTSKPNPITSKKRTTSLPPIIVMTGAYVPMSSAEINKIIRPYIPLINEYEYNNNTKLNSNIFSVESIYESLQG